jgi:hypothetical protein
MNAGAYLHPAAFKLAGGMREASLHVCACRRAPDGRCQGWVAPFSRTMICFSEASEGECRRSPRANVLDDFVGPLSVTRDFVLLAMDDYICAGTY